MSGLVRSAEKTVLWWKERLAGAEEQLQPRQKSRAGVKEAVRAGRARHDVAVRIEYGEAVAVLQYAQRGGFLRLADDGVLLLDLQDLGRHHDTPVSIGRDRRSDSSCS